MSLSWPDAKERKRILKYLAGGSIYFWTGYAVFAICYTGFHWYWLYAKFMADGLGWSFNYIVQRFWAFSDQVSLSEMQHAGRYLFIETIGFFMDYGIIAGLRLIGISPYWGFFISAGFFGVWSYLWYKYWVFPEQQVLYHASSNKEMQSITPQRTLSKDKYIGDYVFATANKKLAAMYLATKGYEIIMEPRAKPAWVAICADKDEYVKGDKGGAIYELPSSAFEKTPQADLDEFERVSREVVRPIKKNIYSSSIEAMQRESVDIYFVTQAIADKLTESKDREAVLASLKAYTPE